jgi:hypothetical protein
MSGEASPMELTRFVELLRATSSSAHIHRGRTEKIARGFYSLLLLWMRSSRVARASGCQCQSRDSPGFDPSIHRHSGIGGAAVEVVLNNVHKTEKI